MTRDLLGSLELPLGTVDLSRGNAEDLAVHADASLRAEIQKRWAA